MQYVVNGLDDMTIIESFISSMVTLCKQFKQKHIFQDLCTGIVIIKKQKQIGFMSGYLYSLIMISNLYVFFVSWLLYLFSIEVITFSLSQFLSRFTDLKISSSKYCYNTYGLQYPIKALESNTVSETEY